MAARKEFKLEGGLEDRVKLTLAARELRKFADSKPDLKNLRDNARGILGILRKNGVTPIDPDMVLGQDEAAIRATTGHAEGYAYSKLEDAISDDVYASARDFYVGSLNDDFKQKFYLSLLREVLSGGESAMPDAPGSKATKKETEAYESFKTLAGMVRFADALKKAVGKGDMNLAKEIAGHHLRGIDLDVLAYASVGYGQPSRNTEANVYNDLADSVMGEAKKLLSEGNLYGLIDKSVEKLPNRKAVSLVEMYNAYNGQKAEELEIAEAQRAAQAHR